MDEHREQEDRYRLIVVDDEPIVHGMIERILRDSDLPLDLVGAFASARDALGSGPNLLPHICLLDIEMGEISGLELAKGLCDVLDYRPVIVYLTAHRKFDYAQQAVKLGALDYLVKPIRSKDVLGALARAVGSIEAERLGQMEAQHLRDQLGSILPAAVSGAGPAEAARQATVARAAMHYINKYYHKRITLADVADHLNLSPGYLGALFKAEYGIALKAYLKRVRIARAKELMRDPRLNLTEIAQRVGFEDISYFSQCFFAETGVRPSEYRGGGRRWPK